MDEVQRLQVIEQGVASTFWKEIVVPELHDRLKSNNTALRNPDLMRKNKLPDDYIRGQLDLIEDLLSKYHVDIEVNRNAIVEENLAKEREDEYTDLRATYGYGLDALSEG